MALSIKQETFLRKDIAENGHQKLVPDSVFLLIWVNSTKRPFHARNYFREKTIRNRIIKTLKIFNYFFLLNSVTGQDYENQKGPYKPRSEKFLY